MPPKPGIQTSEIAVAILAGVLPAIAAIAGYLPPRYAAIAGAIVSVGYSLSRGLAKVPTPIVPPVPPTTVQPPPS